VSGATTAIAATGLNPFSIGLTNLHPFPSRSYEDKLYTFEKSAVIFNEAKVSFQHHCCRKSSSEKNLTINHTSPLLFCFAH
jgi:hypothetical protein